MKHVYHKVQKDLMDRINKDFNKTGVLPMSSVLLSDILQIISDNIGPYSETWKKEL